MFRPVALHNKTSLKGNLAYLSGSYFLSNNTITLIWSVSHVLTPGN